MRQDEFRSSVHELMQSYIRLLDQQRFDEWLTLFDDAGYYAVLRDIEYRDDDNVLLIGEDMRRLSARIDSGKTRDKRRRTHVVCWEDPSTERLSAVVGFMVWLDGRPSSCGRYELSFTAGDGSLKIGSCTAVLDTIDIQDTIYLPI